MKSFQEELNSISPSFCAAKWLQVTVHLQNGNTHSCHHPMTHQVPLNELKSNPSALHNTNQKKQDRKKMLNGQRPSECSYCWKIEDLPGHHNSDRYIKSNDPWARPYLNEIAKKPWNENIDPTYLEVSFSNLCNFQCAYCQPQDSSRWMNEVKRYGPYPTSGHFGSLLHTAKVKALPIDERTNPYVKAFWDWYPQISSKLHELRVTGGEPLLSKDCDRLLDYLMTHPSPQMALNINSNLGISSNILNKFLQKLVFLEKSKAVREINIFTSIDTWGEQAEYLRHGLNLDLWKKNFETTLQQLPNSRLTIMVTYNLLSIFKFLDLLKFVTEMKAQYGSSQVLMDVSLLHQPNFLSVDLLTDQQKALMNSHVDYVSDQRHGYIPYEIDKLKRIAEYLAKDPLPEPELRMKRVDFVSYIKEYDLRKGTDFEKAFPEMKATFQEWSKTGALRRFIYRARTQVLRCIESIYIK